MSSSAVKLGPLTTTFTPPPECSTAFLYYDSVLGVNGYWGESCVSDDVRASAETGVYASSCYPEGWAGPFASNYRGHPDQLAVFSPGLHCPKGWSSACSVERRSEDDGPTDTQSALWSVLKDGETGIGCCPSGYSCATLTDMDFQCVKTLSDGEKVSGSSISGDECDVQKVTVTIEDKFLNKDLYAPQLNLVQDSSRETTTGDSGASTEGDDKGSDENAGSGSGSGGLSQSAIIAIGVCIPIFLIAVGIAVFFILKRRKKTPQPPQEVMVPNDPNIKPELDGAWGGGPGAVPAWQKPEMDSGTSVTAVDGRSSELHGSDAPPLPRRPYQGGYTAYELRGSDYVPPELSATGQIHEMDTTRRS